MVNRTSQFSQIIWAESQACGAYRGVAYKKACKVWFLRQNCRQFKSKAFQDFSSNILTFQPGIDI